VGVPLPNAGSAFSARWPRRPQPHRLTLVALASFSNTGAAQQQSKVLPLLRPLPSLARSEAPENKRENTPPPLVTRDQNDPTYEAHGRVRPEPKCAQARGPHGVTYRLWRRIPSGVTGAAERSGASIELGLAQASSAPPMRRSPRQSEARGRGGVASASRSWRNSSCFLSATETRSAWSMAQLLKVAMESRIAASVRARHEPR